MLQKATDQEESKHSNKKLKHYNYWKLVKIQPQLSVIVYMYDWNSLVVVFADVILQASLTAVCVTDYITCVYIATFYGWIAGTSDFERHYLPIMVSLKTTYCVSLQVLVTWGL